MSLSKREKTTIALALLAALCAGIQFLFFGNAGEAGRSAVEEKTDEAFLLEAAQSLAQNRLTETEKAVLEKTETPWPPKPFVQTVTPSSKTGAETPSRTTSGAVAGNVSYTGYIDAGNRRLAIINGTEYEVGDRVTDSLLTVRGISFRQVLLEDAEGRRYAAPLQDGPDQSSALILLQSE